MSLPWLKIPAMGEVGLIAGVSLQAFPSLSLLTACICVLLYLLLQRTNKKRVSRNPGAT